MGSIEPEPLNLTVGVLALQGAFNEHTQLLRQAISSGLLLSHNNTTINWQFPEVRTAEQLNQCDALIIPGGESTAISLVAERSGILEPLRDFVKLRRKPTWGTCAGLILLAESANRTKRTGQELIGGLDVRVNRNHFGRQVESFQAELDLPFLEESSKGSDSPKFKAIFIRAPVVESLLPQTSGIQEAEAKKDDTIVAPSKSPMNRPVEVLARLPKHKRESEDTGEVVDDTGDIVAVRQGNCFGTSFHPELTGDPRIHRWWLGEVLKNAVDQR